MKKIRHALPPAPLQRLTPYAESVLVDFYHNDGQKLRDGVIRPAPGSLELTYHDQLQLLALYPGLVKKTTSPERKRFTGDQYLRTLLHNQKLVDAVEPVLETFRAMQIPVLALKGLALCEAYYKDLGARYMDDIDLLVPRERAVEALRKLSELGWKVESSGISLEDEEEIREDLQFGHAAGLVSPNGQRLDLHWSLMTEANHPEWNRQIWETALRLEGKSFSILDSTLQLFHACSHGYGAWGGSSSIYWAVDATKILRSPLTPIDWNRFVDCAKTLNLTLTVQGALEYLHGVLQAECLEEPLARLSKVSVSYFEFWEHTIRSSSISKRRQSAFRLFFTAWRGGLFGAPKIVTTLPDFISRRLGARHSWQLPVVLPVKIFQRVLKAFQTT